MAKRPLNYGCPYCGTKNRVTDRELDKEIDIYCKKCKKRIIGKAAPA